MSCPLPTRLPRRGLTCLGLLTLGLRALAAVVTPAQGEAGIRAALAALPPQGGVVELATGTFTVTEPIVLERDGVELRGQGPDTVLWLAPRANCPVVILGSPETPVARRVRGVALRRLAIDGNRAQQDFECWGGHCNEQGRARVRNNGVTIRGADEAVVEDILIRSARSGGVVLEKHCRRVRLARVEAHDNEFDGVAAYETEDSDFVDLRLHRNRSAGFSLDWRFNRNRIRDCRAEGNGSQGIFMRDAIDNTFERVVLSRNAEQGLFVAETRELPGTACRYNRFIAMTITDNGTQGIRVNDASCNPNTLQDSLVARNRLEDLSLADFGQLEVIRPRTE